MMWNKRRTRQSWRPPGHGKTARREVQRVGKIGALPVLVQRMAERFGTFDRGVIRVQQRGEKREEFGARFPVTGA